MKGRYPALSIVASFYRIIGVLIFSFGLIAAIGIPFLIPGAYKTLSIFAGIAIFLIFTAVAVPLYAMGDFYKCFMAIERNTRKDPPDPVIIREEREVVREPKLYEIAQRLAEIPASELIKEGLRRLEEEERKKKEEEENSS